MEGKTTKYSLKKKHFYNCHSRGKRREMNGTTDDSRSVAFFFSVLFFCKKKKGTFFFLGSHRSRLPTVSWRLSFCFCFVCVCVCVCVSFHWIFFCFFSFSIASEASSRNHLKKLAVLPASVLKEHQSLSSWWAIPSPSPFFFKLFFFFFFYIYSLKEKEKKKRRVGVCVFSGYSKGKKKSKVHFFFTASSSFGFAFQVVGRFVLGNFVWPRETKKTIDSKRSFVDRAMKSHFVISFPNSTLERPTNRFLRLGSRSKFYDSVNELPKSPPYPVSTR